MVDYVQAGEVVLGWKIAALERRINVLETLVINLAVSERLAVSQYPIAIGSATRQVSPRANFIHVSIIDGYALVSTSVRTSGFRIELRDKNASLLWKIEGGVTGPAMGVARDSNGNVYATGHGLNSHVVKYNSSQVLQWHITGWDADSLTLPRGCALTNDEAYIWVCDGGLTQRMVKFDTSDGSFVSEFDLDDLGSGPEVPVDVAIDASGNLYISDPLNERIHKYNSDGSTLLAEFGEAGDGDGQFNNLRGIAVAASTLSDSGSFVFAFDADTPTDPFARIQVFDQDGTFLWDRDVNDLDTVFSDTGDIAIMWGDQTEWFYYPTELTSQRVSAGTPDGGVSVPALTFYDGQIVRPNIIAAMQAAIEQVAVNYVNSVTGNPFTWTADADNLYTVAVDPLDDDWDKPTKEALEGTAIRPDELIELDVCISKLEASEIITV